MYKHKRHRHHSNHFFFPGGMIWWFIFAMMFMKGEWWPWFLVAIGFWVVCGSMFKEEKRKPERKDIPASPVEPTPAPPKQTFIETQQAIHRVDLLPATCSQCGGPISPYEVKWRGTQSAACPYCGSNLKMKL